MTRAIPPEAPGLAADQLLVRRTADAMAAKLARKRAQGRGGWHDPAQCSVDQLRAMFLDHAQRALSGDDAQWLDCVNLAAMLMHRTAPPAERTGRGKHEPHARTVVRRGGQ